MPTDFAKAFADLRTETHDVIEALLSHLWRAGDWDDDEEDMLEAWRSSRGEGGMDPWRWWVGYPNCDEFSEDCDTREQAIEAGVRYAEEGKFDIIEARLWNDAVKDGEDICEFAMSRNRETIEAAAND